MLDMLLFLMRDGMLLTLLLLLNITFYRVLSKTSYMCTILAAIAM